MPEKPNEMKLTVLVVCGEAHAGKSTYIADMFGNDPYDVLDIYQFQEYTSYPQSMSRIMACGLSNMLVEMEAMETIRRIYKREQIKKQKCKYDGVEYIPEDLLLIIEGTFMKRARRQSLVQSIRNGIGNHNAVVECAYVYRGGRVSSVMEKPIAELEGFDRVYEVQDYIIQGDKEEVDSIIEKRNAIDRIRQNKYFAVGPMSEEEALTCNREAVKKDPAARFKSE